MKVTMLISRFPPHVGGTENQAFRLARRLVTEGIEVEVLTQRHDVSLPAEEIMGGVRVLRCGATGSSFWGSFSYLVHGLWILSKQSDRAEIFHSHMIAVPSVLACAARLFFGGKVLVKVACSGPLGDVASSKKSLFGKWKLASVLRLASHFASVSNDIESELVAEGVSRESITLVPNGVDADEFKPVENIAAKTALQNKLGLPQGRWLLFSGRLTQQKRPLDLFDAFSSISDKIADLRLIYIGEGDQQELLMEKIRRQNLGDRVLVKRPQPNIRDYYQACDVFVLNSEAEGLSNSLLEAMASGLVCIGTRVGGTIDLIEDGVNGFLISGESSTLSETLGRALGPEINMGEIGRRARQTVLERCELGLIAKKYKDIYVEILAKD